jgi:hypothetical protein
LAPQYVKVAKTLKGVALVGAVDCDDKANSKLCRTHSMQGFPTVKVSWLDLAAAAPGPCCWGGPAACLSAQALDIWQLEQVVARCLPVCLPVK